ncbi:hypothetical protein OG984_04300 [Nocardioides sp. NBC_00368]|uniref:hypothetical protein n=1 Tax=Nocardioides sp. NBC_00368 TaxID=2976000 RepID=UPI002E1EEFE9
MAAWLLILVGAAALVVVIAVVAVVWVLSGRAKPGGAINPNDNPGVQAARGEAERTSIQHRFGDTGPGF